MTFIPISESPESSRPGVHACLRPVSGDDVPIIGQTRVMIYPDHASSPRPPISQYVFIIYQIKNLFANTGHGSKGWTYSWGSATLLAKVNYLSELLRVLPSMSPKSWVRECQEMNHSQVRFNPGLVLSTTSLIFSLKLRLFAEKKLKI